MFIIVYLYSPLKKLYYSFVDTKGSIMFTNNINSAYKFDSRERALDYCVYLKKNYYFSDDLSIFKVEVNIDSLEKVEVV